jgi:hypothetical protein
VKYDDDDRDRAARIAALLEDEDRRWFLDRIAEPWQRRARRLAERDARIREHALAYCPLLSSRATAVAISVAIDRYRASGWRFERDLPAPADQHRRSLWAILHLNDGRSLSSARIRCALASVVIADSPKSPKQAAKPGRSLRLGSKSGTSRNVGGGKATDHGQGR